MPYLEGSYAKFNAEYFFAGYTGPLMEKRYNPGFDQDIYITNRIAIGAVSWSECGASTNFRINTAITAAKRPTSHEDTQIAIDSGDAVARFEYQFVFRQC